MFSKKLKELRKMCSLTQAELADLLEISPSAVGMYEQSRRAPDFKTLIKIADIFGVEIDYLLREDTGQARTTDIDDLLADIRKKLLSQGVEFEGKRLSVKEIDEMIHAARLSFYLTLDRNPFEKRQGFATEN